MILARCGEDAWPALKQALQDPKPEIRRRAVIALNYALPSLETEVTRALLRAQDDSHECVRKPSLECLSELGSNASIDVTNVHRALAGLGDQPREDLGESFCRFDSGAEKIVATLMTLLKDDEPEVRTKAANVIFRFGGVPGVAIVLAEALKNNDSGNLRFALTRLCELGEEAATALPAVKAVLAHKDRSVRELAICAMCALKPNPGSVAAVIAGPADNVDAGNREKAVTVLAKFGPACEFSILELASMILRDNDRFERFSTAYMLKRIDLEPSSSGQSDELRAIEREWRELWMREENQPRHLPHR